MSSRHVARTLAAWTAGKPLPRGSTLHVRVAKPKDILQVAFLRMGGESSPWAIGFGHPSEEPRVLSVGEARNRDDVAAMVAEFAPTLLAHFADSSRLRQLWVPGPSHLVMLDNIAHRYAHAMKAADPKRLETLRRLGRLSIWLHNEAHRPGSLHVVDATSALRTSFAFPADNLRLAHLGFQLALLGTGGGLRDRLEAALDAERLAVSTSLSPVLERDVLEPLVGRLKKSAPDAGKSAARTAIEKVLRAETLRRLGLVEMAIDLLRNDPRPQNPGLDVLEEVSLDELQGYLGAKYILHADTERSGDAAAYRYLGQLASSARANEVILHHDREMQDEEIADGRAVRGIIQRIRNDGAGRKTIPVWTVRCRQGGLHMREGQKAVVAGLPGRKVRIGEITESPDGSRLIEVVVTGWIRANELNGHAVPAATDASLKSTEVTLLPDAAADLLEGQRSRVWRKDGPGEWLTHGAAKAKVKAS